jgi:hypothetical protein
MSSQQPTEIVATATATPINKQTVSVSRPPFTSPLHPFLP